MTKGGTGVQLKVRAEGRCRLCERPREVRQLTKHRLVPGRDGGDYGANNVVPLCRQCHDAVEESAEVRRLLRPLLWPAEVALAISRWGECRFDEAYPRSAVQVAAHARGDLAERHLDEVLARRRARGHSARNVYVKAS